MAACLWALAILFNDGDTLVHMMTTSSNKNITVDSPTPHRLHPVVERLSQHFLQNKHTTAKKAFLLLFSSLFSVSSHPWHLHVYVKRKLSTFYFYNQTWASAWWLATGVPVTPFRWSAAFVHVISVYFGFTDLLTCSKFWKRSGCFKLSCTMNC